MRQFLLFGLPILAPVALYLLWFARAARQASAAGLAPPRLGDAPWAWVIGAGVALAAFVLGLVSFHGAGPASPNYQPPRLIDGQVAPGRVAP
jgi:hypothetical protein